MKQAIIKENTQGLSKQLVILASPMILSNLAYTLLGAADTLFLGRVSTVSLGAVGLAGMMFLTVSLLLRGIINGTIPFVSRMYGAGDYLQAGTYLQHFLGLALLISPVLLVFPAVFRGFFLLLRPDPLVALEAMTYITIRLWELPFSLVSTALIGFMIGVGNTRLPMLLSWSAVILNIAANYVLIFGKLGFPPLGIAGAALGTVIAVIFQTVLGLVFLYRIYGQEFSLTTWRLAKFQDYKKMLRIGFPIGVTDAVEVGAFTAFFALISRLGTVELAASQIANQIASIAFMPGFALSAATGSLVGRYMGASHMKTARRVGFIGAFMGAAAMGALGVVFWIFSTQLGMIFTGDPEVLALTRVLLQMIAFYQAFDGFNIVFRGALNGAGDTRFTMIFTMIGAWLLFIPGVYVGAFVLKWGLVGAWLGAILYILSLGLTLGFRFYQGKWQHIKLE